MVVLIHKSISVGKMLETGEEYYFTIADCLICDYFTILCSS